jgi:hypothetical protein
MLHPCPHHCPDSGGKGRGIIAVVVALAVIAAAARPIAHAAEEVIRVVVDVLIALGVIIAAGAGLAVGYGITRLTRRAQHGHARTREAIPQAAQADQALTDAHRPAIEGRKVYRPEYRLTPLSHVNRRRRHRV